MNKIKKFLLNIWYGLPFGVKAAGDEIMGGLNAASNDTSVSQEVSDHRVGKHLLKGEITQEVEELRYRTYKVSNEAERYKYLGNGAAIKEDTPTIKSTEVGHIKFSQENGMICSSILEEFRHMNDYGTERYKFEMMYSDVVRFKLEQFATSVDVEIDTRKGVSPVVIDTTLHFEKQPNPYNPKSKPFINELSKLVGADSHEVSMSEIASSLLALSFTTYKANGENDFVNYSFTDKGVFKRITETEHEYLLTFSWEGYVRLPLDLEATYYSKEMDDKYKTNAKKEVSAEMVHAERKAYCYVCGREMSVYDADIMEANGEHPICKSCMEMALNGK